MRTLDVASAFKRDFKRESSGRHGRTLALVLDPVLLALATDQEFDSRRLDHELVGDWKGYRECHLKPDLLLIYRKSGSVDAGILRLARLGSHSELFG